MHPLVRLLLSVPLLALAAFGVFGFLATFEPVANALPWRIGYAAMLVLCLAGLVRLTRPGRRG